MIIFGDSLSDTGNLSNSTDHNSEIQKHQPFFIKKLIKYQIHQIPPNYSQYNGRLTDGYNWVDQLSYENNIKVVNQAVTGASIVRYKFKKRNQISNIEIFQYQLSKSIQDQQDSFKNDLSNNKIDQNKNDLIVIMAGVNDVIIYKDQSDSSEMVDMMFDCINKFVSLGYNNIIVGNIPPVQHNPQVQFKNIDQITIVSKIKSFNEKLNDKIYLYNNKQDYKKSIHSKTSNPELQQKYYNSSEKEQMNTDLQDKINEPLNFKEINDKIDQHNYNYHNSISSKIINAEYKMQNNTSKQLHKINDLEDEYKYESKILLFDISKFLQTEYDNWPDKDTFSIPCQLGNCEINIGNNFINNVNYQFKAQIMKTKLINQNTFRIRDKFEEEIYQNQFRKYFNEQNKQKSKGSSLIKKLQIQKVSKSLEYHFKNTRCSVAQTQKYNQYDDNHPMSYQHKKIAIQFHDFIEQFNIANFLHNDDDGYDIFANIQHNDNDVNDDVLEELMSYSNNGSETSEDTILSRSSSMNYINQQQFDQN